MSLKERDQQHIWHPLTQHKLQPYALPISKAKGALLYDASGKEYIDAISSWYTCMYGHCNEFIIDKVQQQLKQLDHVIFAGFTHEPAVVLAEELMKILPANQRKVFFSDNGSTSVEVALKMAVQYHSNKGAKKNIIVAFEEGFHGDTFGAMSVSGLSVYNGPFEDLLLEVYKIPVPNAANAEMVVEQFTQLLNEHQVAAFIYEPILQGAAGMKMYHADLLEPLLKIAKENHVLTIADEVMTGFGKTGKNFASDYLSTKPDIICLSKSLTGGIGPMAVTTCTEEIFAAFYDQEISKGLFHAHTYSANPLCCTAAIAAIELLQSDEMQNNIQRISNQHQQFAADIEKHPMVKGTWQLGVVFGMELDITADRYGEINVKLKEYFMKKGVFLRPLGSIIYILPPFITSDSELNKIYQTITAALDQIEY